MSAGVLADAIEKALQSTSDRSNLTDAVRRLGAAITPNVIGCSDATGGHVESLTEAVIGMTAGLCRIADAIESLAEAVREHE